MANKIYAPYSKNLYKKLIQRLLSDTNIEHVKFENETTKTTGKSKLYIRHDIDFLNCAKNLNSFIDINIELNVFPGIFVRVDDKEYNAKDYLVPLTKARQAGCAVGLHTVCYTQGNSLYNFKSEIEKFTYELSFSPNTFTIHGLGEFRKEQRLKFVEDILPRLNDFGMTFTDCQTNPGFYSKIIQDCNLDTKTNQRYLDDEFSGKHLQIGDKRCLILIHPSYWQNQ